MPLYRDIQELWDQNKIQRSQFYNVRCEGGTESGQCKTESIYRYRDRYYCSDCMISILMLKLWKKENEGE